jgi:anti-repressor protein
MSDLVPAGPQAFSFEGQEVRVVAVDSEPRWVVNDVCAALDIADPSVALRRVDEADQCQTPVRSGGQQRLMNVVNESGLYELIFRSDKPAAKRFRRWVTSVVLPSIRKTGGYGRQVALPASYSDALRELAAEIDKRAELEAQNDAQRLEIVAQAEIVAEQEPKVDAWQRLIDSTGLFSMAVVAKAFGTGPIRLFAYLRRHRVLISVAGERYNTPYQNHVETGRFEIKMDSYPDKNGNKRATYTTMVTPKGVEFIRQLIERNGSVG